MQHHPDKNFGNKASEAKFKEITEAYKVLSDLKLRQEYNIRINLFTQSEQKKSTPSTPASLLKQVIIFRKKIAVLDPERMNRRALYQHIQHLLSKHNIIILQQTNDLSINKKIISEILYCARFLPFSHVEKICVQLTALAGTDNNLYRTIYNFSKESQRREFLDKYKLIFALIITFLFCILIYFISERY